MTGAHSRPDAGDGPFHVGVCLVEVDSGPKRVLLWGREE